MQKFTLHVVGLPHTAANDDYVTCAFTQKVVGFCSMMTKLGHKVIHYGGQGSVIEGEHVDIITKAQREEFFGKFDPQQNYPIVWDDQKPYWIYANLKTIEKIQERAKPTDIICYIGGNCQMSIAKAFPEHFNVEIGIGYQGTFAPFRIFESYAHMHWVYGFINRSDNGQNFDAVIPNYYNPNDFHLAEKEDYLLFIGRMIHRKWPHIAVEMAKQMGKKIKMVGQGLIRQEGNKYIFNDVAFEGDHIEFIWAVGKEQRAELMAKALATIVPTTYLEPFWGVAVESMLSGTPVIASDYGAFPETVKHGKNGYRFRFLGEGVSGLKNLAKLQSPKNIRAAAKAIYSRDVVSLQYQAYFEQLVLLRTEGWSSLKDLSMYPRYR